MHTTTQGLWNRVEELIDLEKGNWSSQMNLSAREKLFNLLPILADAEEEYEGKDGRPWRWLAAAKKRPLCEGQKTTNWYNLAGNFGDTDIFSDIPDKLFGKLVGGSRSKYSRSYQSLADAFADFYQAWKAVPQPFPVPNPLTIPS